MAHMKLDVSPAKDGLHVCIEMHMDGKPLGHIFLSGSDCEELCQTIARSRRTLPDQVSPEIDPNSRLAASFDPVCTVFPRHSGDMHGVALALRHPGLGWLSFLLPAPKAAELGAQLVAAMKQ